uniref:Uncharacterized protein n=1 Tax=Parastrongyloides trichosuri TaxID=131310 RepID=A0A0N4ZJR8_PARTI
MNTEIEMIRSQKKSNLALQIVLETSKIFSIFYFIVLCVGYIYKATSLTYPLYIKIIESFIILEILPVEMLKYSWGKRGNLTQTWAHLVLSSLLNILNVFICCYLLFFQAYLLSVEFYLIIIQSCFTLLLLLLSITASIIFVK